MLRYRLVVGPLMIAAIVALCWLDNQLDRLPGLLMLLLFLAVIPLGARELQRLFAGKAMSPDTPTLALGGIVGCVLAYGIPVAPTGRGVGLAVGLSVIGVVFLVALVRHCWPARRTQGAMAAAAAAMFAVAYLGLLPGFLLAVRRGHTAWLVLAIILITKSCDIGAYFTGRWLGRHKLIPWLSPGKTWEGLVGGVATSAAVALGAAMLLNALQGHFGTQVPITGYWQAAGVGATPTFVPMDLPLLGALLAGAVFGLVGQFGDLVASVLKRDAGIKDSGASIPGFGGVIDVLDSIIVVAPLAYWLLQLAAVASGQPPG